jgi:hypothetical protein
MGVVLLFLSQREARLLGGDAGQSLGVGVGYALFPAGEREAAPVVDHASATVFLPVLLQISSAIACGFSQPTAIESPAVGFVAGACSVIACEPAQPAREASAGRPV